jgi:hypothetical protein
LALDGYWPEGVSNMEIFALGFLAGFASGLASACYEVKRQLKKKGLIKG